MRAAFVALLAGIVLAGAALSAAVDLGDLGRVDAQRATAAASATTFSRDVAPIFLRHCVTCHNPGPHSAFSLLTYGDARPRAKLIAAVTKRRHMPPWAPEPGYGDAFLGARRLNDEEIATIERWAAAGAPQGDLGDLPEPPHWSAGWRLGAPDVIIRMPEAYSLRAEGPDVFRTFVLPIPVDDVRYVKAIEFIAGTRAVHHANMRIDETPTSRRLDEEDPAPGYDGLIAATARYPEGYFFGWTPGQLPPMSPDLAWRLNPGSDMVIQLHLRPTGQIERVQIAVGLYFASGPPRLTPVMLRLGKQYIDIAPGEKEHVVTDAYILPVDVEVHAVQPHAHYRAKNIQGFATLPDGTTKWLIFISAWNFDWQDQYRYVKPFPLPKGTTVTMRYTYDNSAANRQNPQLPPQRVHWGQASSDEMGDLWIQVVPRSPADHDLLVREFRQKVFQEDIVGYETVLRATPNDVALHDDVALLYMAVGRIADAIEDFSQSVRLRPAAAATHYNLGTALTAAGRIDDAIAQYRQALQLRPDYADALNNLGSLMLTKGQLEEATSYLNRALEVDAAHADAHNNLGKALAYEGHADKAIDHLRRALVIRPRHPDAHYNLAHVLVAQGHAWEAVEHYRTALNLRPEWPPVLSEAAWLLATCPDERVREPSQAISFAERAVALANERDPVRLDVLAAAYAAGGRFDRAVSAARAALDLIPESYPATASGAIRERLAMYERGRPYVDVHAAGPIHVRP